jgi:hypothetical protein
MKARTVTLALMVCFLGKVVLFAQDVQMGTWRLNAAKSKFSARAMRYSVVVFQAAGEEVSVTVGGTDAHGKPARNEWRGKFNGKDYPVVGNPAEDMRSYTIVDDHTLGFNTKKGSEITISGRIAVSPDGRSRTVTTTGTDSRGRKFTSIAVYEKQ